MFAWVLSHRHVLFSFVLFLIFILLYFDTLASFSSTTCWFWHFAGFDTKKSGCPLPNLHFEGSFANDLHVCQKVEDVWIEAGLWKFIHDKLEHHMVLWHYCFSASRIQHTCCMFVMTLWCIWRRRNNKHWNDVGILPHVAVRTTHNTWMEWKQVHKEHDATTREDFGLVADCNINYRIRW